MFLYMVLFSKINVIVLYFLIGFVLLFTLIPFLILPSRWAVRKGDIRMQLLVISLFSVSAIVWFSYLIRDLNDITSPGFFSELIIFCIFLFGEMNSVYVTIQLANEKLGKKS